MGGLRSLHFSWEFCKDILTTAGASLTLKNTDITVDLLLLSHVRA